MQSIVLSGEKWGYICIIIGLLICIWFILDFFSIHKSKYSVHRILNLSDNIYKIICIIFFILAFIGSAYFYVEFFRVSIENNTIRIIYLFPKIPKTLSNKEIKSYLIKVPREDKNRILCIFLTNGKKYRSVPVGPEYQEQLYQLTGVLERIIEENSRKK